MLFVAEEEQRIESYRQSLVHLPHFEPYAGFSRLEKHSCGWITAADMAQFLSENNFFHLKEAHCLYMVKYFDSDPASHSGSQLDYQDFLSIVLPCADPHLRAAAT